MNAPISIISRAVRGLPARLVPVVAVTALGFVVVQLDVTS